MASSQTTNYSLPQWSKSDRIQMSDFNTAMSTIDAALAAAGNCRIVTGSYIGTGTYGSGSKNTLTFNQKPLALFVGGGGYSLFTTCASTYASVFLGVGTNQYYGCTVEWSDAGVSWYSGSYQDYQMNSSGKTYQYLALLEC